MCGFAGAIAVEGGAQADEGLIREMGACMWRRGPDDDGSWSNERFALAFRRLSIIDLSPAGHQPFVSEDGNRVIVFNGEIFNYLELREELRSLGHRFRSDSDTEVLLAAYAQWGTDCLSRLNGMWAFLIVDLRLGRLFAARDRFGIKPLYRTRVGGVEYFASEIKALRKVLPQGGTVNWTLAARFLGEGRLDTLDTGTETFFNEVRQVPPAHGLTITLDGNEREWRYWSLPESNPQADANAPDALCALLEDAVRLRLRSDVPVGVALSGGMDSSTIAGFMAKLRGTKDGKAMHGLHAFSYMEKAFDEEPYINDTLALTKAELHRTSLSPTELWSTLPEVLAAHDEPLHSPTALAGYQVYALAARAGVRVVLGGQGADESLAGYPNYFIEHWFDLLRARRMGTLLSDIADYADGHGRSRSSLLVPLLTRALAKALPRPKLTKMRAQYAHWLSISGSERAALFGTHAHPRTLRESLAQSLEAHPLPLFLRVEDRNSMAHSVEARLPFLDYRVVSLAFQLSNTWKIRGRWNKHVLREATKGVIPESVRTRVDKMGFPTGFPAWIRGPLAPVIEERVSQMRSDVAGGIIDVHRVRQLLAEHKSGVADHGLALFHVLQFDEWERRLADTRSHEARTAA